MTTTLTINHIKMGFQVEGKNSLVIDDVSMDIAKGEFVSIVGPSGSGKTTLLRIIGGLLKPNSGSISLFGGNTKDAQKAKA